MSGEKQRHCFWALRVRAEVVGSGKGGPAAGRLEREWSTDAGRARVSDTVWVLLYDVRTEYVHSLFVGGLLKSIPSGMRGAHAR